MTTNPEVTLLAQQSNAALADGNLTLAWQLCQQLLGNYPSHAPGWALSAKIALQASDPKTALHHVTEALSISPGNPAWQLLRAKILVQSGDMTRALTQLDSLDESGLDSSEMLTELAYIENLCGRAEAAENHYRMALSRAPDNLEIRFNLATLQRYNGKIAEAEASLENVIALAPMDCEAHLLLSSLKKQSLERNHIGRLEQILASPPSPLSRLQKAQLLYALAKEQEDLAHYDASFAALKQGAQVKRSNMQYQVDSDVATLEKLREVFDNDFLQHADNGCDSREPIFILGLPRTGSTLVERVLSAHSQVASAGELNNFSLVMMQQCKARFSAPPKSKLQLVEMTRQLDMTELGQAYLDSTRPLSGQLPHFIDKLPLNSLNLGLISRALPNAKLIYIQRHPLDTCYAIYKQLFTQGYPFSYDLDELGRYYIAHHQLMTHFQQALGERLLTVSYETLVSDFPAQVKRLLAYCELDWEAGCEHFHSQQAAAKTASATQVRQPVYTASVAKWRHYADHLQPLKTALENAGIACD